MTGPLAGLRVLELATNGPVMHAAMFLADLGADVIRIERHPEVPNNPLLRGRRSVSLDLKSDADVTTVLRLVADADVLLEGFRPGVTERLGLGPEVCLKNNPKLIYGRMTGWGQDGPLAAKAGHDINYLSITGALDAIGAAGGPPIPPLNLVADFGGGSMFLIAGLLAALWERERSGAGQVVDAAMVDGASSLLQSTWFLRQMGQWSGGRGTNLLDGGAPFYGVYECADGGHVAVGAIEPQFYAQLLNGLALDAADLPAQSDQTNWPTLRAAFAEAFARYPRSHWEQVFAEIDACVTPVLTFEEVPHYPHIQQRGTVTLSGGNPQAAPAPRFSRTQPVARSVPNPAAAGADSIVW